MSPKQVLMVPDVFIATVRAPRSPNTPETYTFMKVDDISFSKRHRTRRSNGALGSPNDDPELTIDFNSGQIIIKNQ